MLLLYVMKFIATIIFWLEGAFPSFPELSVPASNGGLIRVVSLFLRENKHSMARPAVYLRHRPVHSQISHVGKQPHVVARQITTTETRDYNSGQEQT